MVVDALVGRALEVWALESSLFLLELLWVAVARRRDPGGARPFVLTYAAIGVAVLVRSTRASGEALVRWVFAAVQLVTLADLLARSWLSMCLPLLVALVLATAPASLGGGRETRALAALNALWHAATGGPRGAYVAAAIALFLLSSECTPLAQRVLEACACELCIVGALEVVGWSIDSRLWSDAPLGTQVLCCMCGLESRSLTRWAEWVEERQAAERLPEPLRGTWWAVSRGVVPTRGFAFVDVRRAGGRIYAPLAAPAQRAVERSVAGFAWCYVESLFPPLAAELAEGGAGEWRVVAIHVGPLRVAWPGSRVVVRADDALHEVGGRADMYRRKPTLETVLLTSPSVRRRLVRATMLLVDLPRR